jgi:transposase
MEARVVNDLPPAAAHDGAGRCLLAFELNKKSWVVAVNTPLSRVLGMEAKWPAASRTSAPSCKRPEITATRNTLSLVPPPWVDEAEEPEHPHSPGA